MSLHSNELPELNRSTPCPKGEIVESHAGNAGEASDIDARQISQKADSVIGSDNSLERSGDSIEIVRATSRFELALTHDKEKGERCKGKDDCPACALLYALRVTQNRCASAINMAMRAYWKSDAKTLDDYISEHHEKPKGKNWPFPILSIYQMIRGAYPELSSGIAASLAQKAMLKWRQTRFDALIRNICAPAHFRETMPIPVRKQDVRVVEISDGVYHLRFSLTSGRHLHLTMLIRLTPNNLIWTNILQF